jgi:Fic family protein
MIPELISEAYMYLIDNQDKLYQLVEESGPESIIVRFMQYQIIWSKTKFKKNNIINNNNLNLDIETSEEDDDIINNKYVLEKLITLEDEQEDILEKEKEFQDKYNELQIKIQNLSKKNQQVWVLYQQGYNNSGKLSKHIGLSRNTCYHIIRDMREELGYVHKPKKRK